MEKRRNCSKGAISPLFHNIFYLLDFHVYAGTRISLRDKRLFEISEFEITRVNCICNNCFKILFLRNKNTDLEQTPRSVVSNLSLHCLSKPFSWNASYLCSFFFNSPECPALRVSHAVVNPATIVAHGTTVTVECLSSFTLVGNPNPACDNGEFTDTPTCENLDVFDISGINKSL